MMTPLVAGYLRRREVVVVMVLGAILLAGFGRDSRASFTAIALSLALLSWLLIPSGLNTFTCALPIRGRDLVMSRALAIVAVTGIPIVGWLAVEGMSGQLPAVMLLPGAWLSALVLALGVAGAGAWIYHTVPDALPLPIKEVAGWKRVAERASGTDADTAWWSVVRTALPPTYAMYCVMLASTAAVGIATMFYCLVLLSLPPMIRQRTAWLAMLPVSNRQRLHVVGLPTVVASVACIEVGRALQLPLLVRQGARSADYRIWLVDAVLLIVAGVAVLLITEIGGELSRRRSGLLALFLRELAVLPVATIVVADIVLHARGAEGFIAVTTRTLHHTVERSPVHAWSVLVLAVTLLVTAYALLEHQFRRSGTSGAAGVQAA